MSVGLLIITHGRIGEQLLETAKSMLGMCPLHTTYMPVSQSTDPEDLLVQARRTCESLNQGDGVLVLTDMYGSTPSNVANRLLKEPQVEVVAGINLPMLIRILNYPSLNLHEMINKALSGGHDGILLCALDEYTHDQ